MQIWGDANLWYKLAEANGLSGMSGLAEGQRLTIPAGVMRSTHNASTLTPYDPAETLGDVSPTTHLETTTTWSASPQPRKGNKCGILGMVLLVAVAVAVTVVTSGALAAASISAVSGSSVGLGAGITAALGGGGLTTIGMMAVGAAGAAAGSIVSQGLGVATGLQDKFSWKGVAMAAISGGVGGGLGNVIRGAGVAAAAARGALGSAITQGIGLTLGLQKKFDFAGVAAAAVGSVAGSAFKRNVLGVSGQFAKNAGGYAMSAATGMAGAIGNAATRSLIEGSSFGDNVLRSLPDVIGSTIGNMIADGVAAMARRPKQASAAMGGPEEILENRPTNDRRPQSGEEALHNALHAVDVLSSEDAGPIAANDPNILARNIAAVAWWGSIDDYGEYRDVLARGIQSTIDRWGGDTTLLANELSAVGRGSDFNGIATLIGDLGLVGSDDGFIFHSAADLLHGYVANEKGHIAGLAAYTSYQALRETVSTARTTFIEPITDPAANLQHDAQSVTQAGYDAAHVANHLAKGELPFASGQRFVFGQIGSKGSWSPELNASSFHPNSTYIVNGYTYTTDSAGRVTSVEGRLSSGTAARNRYRQSQVGRSSGVPGDHGGHLIASIFNGPGDRLNMVPMNGNLNMGRWRAMENTWAASLRSGQTVHVNVEAIYRDQSKRPSDFNVIYSIGKNIHRANFKNRR
jgi:hypothetical protein